jgi:uncharacterized protein (DUF2235 family)
MKRLVICCDGTWNRPESDNITNIEKIARTVAIDSDRSGGVQQLVLYISGVGSHWFWIDRVLGGAFGFGLFANVTEGYRFIALNYEPGDEIFAFGFSRGAYTARSIVGMIGRVGLLTRDAMVDGKLPEAVDRYRLRKPKDGFYGASNEEFKRDFCHQPKINFLGVFDTVGALGVPGALGHKNKFHDVRLGDAVSCARQALAIDEPRIKFEPAIWETSEPNDQQALFDTAGDRIKQVWFEGAHSDVGGGYTPSGLSDTTLLWMTQQAEQRGLVFEHDRLDHYVASGDSPRRHNPMNAGYRVLNAISRVKFAFSPNPHFRHGHRVLDPPNARGVRIARSAATHWQEDAEYRPGNIEWLRENQRDGELAPVTEDCEALPLRVSSWKARDRSSGPGAGSHWV